MYDLLAGFDIDKLDLDRREHVDSGGELHVGIHYHVQAHRHQ